LDLFLWLIVIISSILVLSAIGNIVYCFIKFIYPIYKKNGKKIIMYTYKCLKCDQEADIIVTTDPNWTTKCGKCDGQLTVTSVDKQNFKEGCYNYE
jgi:DNA-directed RNA polymerase subunit RPC12/RpoP